MKQGSRHICRRETFPIPRSTEPRPIPLPAGIGRREATAQVAKKYLALFAKIGMLQSLTPPSSGPAAPARNDSDDDRFLVQTTSVLSPSVWLAAAHALPGELISFGRWLKSWSVRVRDSGGLSRAAVGLLIVTVLAIAVFVFWFCRRHRRTAAPAR